MGITDSNRTTDRGNDAVEVLSSDGSGFAAKVDSDLRLWVRPPNNDDDNRFDNSFNSTVRWLDMNVSNGGVARDTVIGTTFTNIFSYNGSGYFLGLNVNLEDAKNWYLRVIVDGQYVFFESAGIFIKDLNGGNLYDMKDVKEAQNLGIGFHDDSTRFDSPYPIRFTSSVQIQARRNSGSKKFRAGYTLVVKES